jgi:Ca2+-binding RTX toxin-like protein
MKRLALLLTTLVVLIPTPAQGDARACAGKELTKAGTPGDDRLDLRYGRRNDVVHLFKGDDRTRTGPGRDTICGGAGDDVLHGGRGADWIETGRDHNTVWCGKGEDVAVVNENDAVSHCETVLLRND